MNMNSFNLSSQGSEGGSMNASPSKSPIKQMYAKKQFIHFGFLVVEAWCAYGMQFDCVSSMRDRAAGDESMTFLESIMARERLVNPALVGDIVPGSDVTGFPRCRQRVLTTWPVNSLWTECFIELGIDDSSASNASEQMAIFFSGMNWGNHDNSTHVGGFLACLQCWYYGMPVQKV
jgi:hypothetical protein